jgi:hypothetical protein
MAWYLTNVLQVPSQNVSPLGASQSDVVTGSVLAPATELLEIELTVESSQRLLKEGIEMFESDLLTDVDMVCDDIDNEDVENYYHQRRFAAAYLTWIISMVRFFISQELFC